MILWPEIHWLCWWYVINIIQTKFIDKNLSMVRLVEEDSIIAGLVNRYNIKLLCSIFNFSVIILSSTFDVFSLFSIISLSKNDMVTCLSHQDWLNGWDDLYIFTYIFTCSFPSCWPAWSIQFENIDDID